MRILFIWDIIGKPGRFNSVLVEVDSVSGRALSIQRVDRTTEEDG